MSHKIQLTRELVDQIIFGMENQEDSFFLDLSKGLVLDISRKEPGREDYQIPLPKWKPSDGFLVMDQFVSSLNNPIYKEDFKRILHSGRGVFRKFKDLIKEQPGMERHWYRFKHQEMQAIILKWLETYEDYLDLCHLGEEPEWLEELILTDFRLSEDNEEKLEEINNLDKQIWQELFLKYPESYRRELVARYRRNGDFHPDQSNHLLTMQDEQGGLAAFLWYEKKEQILLIRSLYTLPGYRSMGLATQLLNKVIDLAEKSKDVVLLEAAPIPAEPRLEQLFFSLGFQRDGGGLILSLE